MIRAEIQSLEHSAIIELFELDATILGAPQKLYFHAGTNEIAAPIVWQTNTYAPMPIEASGFEWSGKGQLPRPKMKISNVLGEVGAYAALYDALSGAKITRRKTLAKYLDGVNFPSGNPYADPSQAFPDEIWFIDRMASENPIFMEFELACPFDVAGINLPSRQYIANCCAWVYRSSECSYAGGPVADTNDNVLDETGNPITSLNDMCGGKLASCKLRFGEFATLPYGGFPGVGLVR
ncbi:MAG TPA: phage minor tail protein L [Gallionellaceae bacterium]|nr:phage minor tail protein L [Gallionellaceae bacterium]